MVTKAELRTAYLQKRKDLTEAEYLQLNNRVAERFFALSDLSFIKVVHTFIPIIANHEPDTWMIIDRIRREFPIIRFSIPRINRMTDALENYFYEGLHQLEENSWGIKQPRQGIPTEPEKIDLVLVPLLVFDKLGHRIGYGKGYYDRFLKMCRPDCKKVGLSLFAPIDKIPAESQDVKLNQCITPDALFEF